MLTELKITNFAIIDELTVSFDEGLTVITGETGTGKSIIIGAVGLLLGDKASSDLIRTSEETAQVEASFQIGRLKQVSELLRSMGIPGGDELSIKRIISRTGRNRVFINGELATLQMLSRIVEHLINICGQHEHQLILNAVNHIDVLDEFGGILPLRAEFADFYLRHRQLEEGHKQLLGSKKSRDERKELIGFQLGELNALDLTPGEDGLLQSEKRVLINTQRLLDLARTGYHTLYAQNNPVLGELRRAIGTVAEIGKIDPSLPVKKEDCEDIYYRLEDVALALRDYSEKLSFDPERLTAIEERLEAIGRLKRKYGGSIENIIAKRAELEREQTAISSLDEEIAARSALLETSRQELRLRADVLTGKRKEAALILKSALEAELSALRMAEARFEVSFEPKGTVKERGESEKGQDQVEFYLSTNPGEDLKPLNRIASGGELSRIILAVKRTLAEAARIGTVIFDEVDSGIGGATAQTVGRKLKEVAGHHQVICITHLAPIACAGDAHWRVIKKPLSGRRVSAIERLGGGERVLEIARMLGGAEITETTLAHAREMLGNQTGEPKG